jgi:hypothetical protein
MSDVPSSLTPPVADAPPAVVTASDDGNVLVVAENPGELQTAQAALVDWFERKVTAIGRDLADARQNLEDARNEGWRLPPFQKIVRDLENNSLYYEKALDAVREGYCIVPNFPVDVVAIRTVADHPQGSETTRGNWRPRIEFEADKNLASGEGRYVDPVATAVMAHSEKDEKSCVITKFWEANEFREVALPVKFMKPRVLQATQHAMACKIFDDVAVLPRRRKADPIVVGRIHGPNGKHLTFLVAWFIDTKDL